LGGISTCLKTRPVVVEGLSMPFNLAGQFLKKHKIDQIHNLTPTSLARIIRFLTGHTFMNCHEVLIQRGRDDLESEDALCLLCEEERETPEHLLTECPVLNLDRQALFNSYKLQQVPEWDPHILKMIMLLTIASMED
jgi:hypothetical protein